MTSVAPAPNDDIVNPYIELLYESVDAQEGFDVVDLDFTVLDLLLTNKKPDIIHLHWLHGFYLRTFPLPVVVLTAIRFLLLVTLARFRAKSFVWTGHNLWPHEVRHPRIERFVREYVISSSDVVFVHCEEAIEKFETTFDSDTEYVRIEHGSYASHFDTNKSRDEARRELDIGLDETVLLSFGSIREYKGQEKLCEVLSQLDADCSLYIAGKPWADDVVASVRAASEGDPRIHLDIGYIPEDRVTQYFRAADFVVLPYNTILMSGNVLLAFSMGRPVVVPTIGCMPEYVTEETGILYDSEEELKSVIRSIANSNVKEFDETSIKAYAKQFDWDTVAATHCAWYHSVTSQ